MNPVSPESVAPARKHRTRKAPAAPNERAMLPLGLETFVAVKKISTARGTTMIPMARNCLRRKATAPSWMAAAISRIFGVPVSAASTPRIRKSPTPRPKMAVTRATTSHVFSVPEKTKL